MTKEQYLKLISLIASQQAVKLVGDNAEKLQAFAIQAGVIGAVKILLPEHLFRQFIRDCDIDPIDLGEMLDLVKDGEEEGSIEV